MSTEIRNDGGRFALSQTTNFQGETHERWISVVTRGHDLVKWVEQAVSASSVGVVAGSWLELASEVSAPSTPDAYLLDGRDVDLNDLFVCIGRLAKRGRPIMLVVDDPGLEVAVRALGAASVFLWQADDEAALRRIEIGLLHMVRRSVSTQIVEGSRVHGMTRLLIVEDDMPLLELLRYNLEAEGFNVDCTTTGDDVESIITTDEFALVMLDWMLPHISGIEVLRQIRGTPRTRSLPVIMLTARGEEADRIRGLALGADDYVVKPFSMPELLQRIKTCLRRSSPKTFLDELKCGSLVLHRGARRVTRNGREVRLGPTQFRLLETLMENSDRVFSRGQLLDAVWGRDACVDERRVDFHIGRLRKALCHGKERDPIRTIRGVGYVLMEHKR